MCLERELLQKKQPNALQTIASNYSELCSSTTVLWYDVCYLVPIFGCILMRREAVTHSGVCRTAAATRRKCVFTFGGWSASFRGADAAQVCSNVGIVAIDGVFECSCAMPARQIVSERWREGGGLKHMMSLAATSAFDSTKRRVTSRWPLMAELCSGVL